MKGNVKSQLAFTISSHLSETVPLTGLDPLSNFDCCKVSGKIAIYESDNTCICIYTRTTNT